MALDGWMVQEDLMGWHLRGSLDGTRTLSTRIQGPCWCSRWETGDSKGSRGTDFGGGRER